LKHIACRGGIAVKKWIRFSPAIILILIHFLDPAVSSADNAPLAPMALHSAYRGPNESARAAYNRYLRRLGSRQTLAIKQGTSALDVAKPLAQLNLALLPVWPNQQPQQGPLMKGFFAVRNYRFLQTSDHPGLKRRSSWFYPDDGCFARAALMGQNLAKWGYPRPAKIFIFGDLNVRTANSPSGAVGWWYHVVPIVRIGNTAAVLDPAIDPTRPLTLQEWVSTMTQAPSSVTASICSPYAYSPSSDCLSATAADEAGAVSDQQSYLGYEWERVQSLGRNPLVELGDSPTWRKP